MKPRIAIDMDDTVADTLSRHLQWYNDEFGACIGKEQTLGKKIYDVVPLEHRTVVEAYPHHKDFFRDLPVKKYACEVIKDLSARYEIFFASAAMEVPNSFDAKFAWLKTHFPFVDPMNYIFCGYKGILDCDYLIDDSSRHLDVFKGRGLLFSAPHNINEQGYTRADSWLDVAKLLKA
ncbi:MAG: 5'-nucleotidase [Flavobacteriales bacterium]|jgi:5'-nucleotidase